MADVVRTRADLAAVRRSLRGEVGVVMTMGALHDGHRALLRAARARTEHVVATIFVNPLQFGPHEDFTRYPRTLEADLEVCRAEGVDVVFAPSRDEVYPDGRAGVRVDPGELGTILEGAHRPGHFTGVLTVVLKLLNLTRADVAFFGEKDYQQLTLIRAMVADLDMLVDVTGVATVREPDGLALSSRNRFLGPADRDAARALSRALRAGVAAGAAGLDVTGVLGAARSEALRTPAVALDYLELTDANLGPPPPRGEARLLIAGRVGGTRLIDNVAIDLTAAQSLVGTSLNT